MQVRAVKKTTISYTLSLTVFTGNQTSTDTYKQQIHTVYFIYGYLLNVEYTDFAAILNALHRFSYCPAEGSIALYLWI